MVMVTDESRYIVYLRAGRCWVCNQCYKIMLQDDKIIEENIISYQTASYIAENLNFELLSSGNHPDKR